MIEENKNLLLQDLSSRLPHGVKLEYNNRAKVGTEITCPICSTIINK